MLIIPLIVATMMLLAVIVFSSASIGTLSPVSGQQSVPELQMPPRAAETEEITAFDNVTGIRFFGNGTGTAYLDDNTTKSFSHGLTDKIHYYDDSVIYYAGDIPDTVLEEWGFNGTTTSNDNNITDSSITNGTVYDVTIFRGDISPGSEISVFDPDILVIKVNDTVRWTNFDRHILGHIISSPPAASKFMSMEFQSDMIGGGESWSYTFTRPGGFLYSIGPGGVPYDAGTIIVVGDDEEQAAIMMKVEEWKNQERR